MLENFVAWVLNNYIGEYLEDLNTTQLSVALLSGQVELENVPLKKTALRKFDLPLRVKGGLLGKLTLTIPLAYVRSQPWTLNLSDVLIILGPLPEDQKYDVAVLDQNEQNKKQQLLEELENNHKKLLLELLGIQPADSQDSWWGASLLSTVMNNIQLILNNVHIRYEDNTTIPGSTFSFGFRIQKMTMTTTNGQWKTGFVEPQDGVSVFKKLDISGFCLYWNSQSAMSEDISTPQKIRKVLAPETTSNTNVIDQCSLELRMEKNSSKFPLKQKVPRFKFFLRPDQITCELTQRQMAELRTLNREWARFERARMHRKWRPLVGVMGNAKQWWYFAYQRITKQKRTRHSTGSWDYAKLRAEYMNAYCKAYRRKLIQIMENAKRGSSKTQEDTTQGENRAIMSQIENDEEFSFHDLQLFREAVFKKLMTEQEKKLGITVSPTGPTEQFEHLEIPEKMNVDEARTSTGSAGMYSWITGFFVQTTEDVEVHEDKKFDFSNIDVSELRDMPSSMKMKDMEEEILDVLHETWDDSTLLRRDVLLAQIGLQLEHFTLRFVDTVKIDGMEQRRVLAIEFSGLKAQLELSPKQHQVIVDLTVQDMGVQRLRTGFQSKSNNEVSESLLSSTNESTKILLAVGRDETEVREGSNVPMFSMHYSRRSPRLVTTHILNCRARPVSVIYEEGALEGIDTLFSDKVLTEMSVRPMDLDDDFDTQLDPFKEKESIIESHVFLNLQIPNITAEVRSRGWTRRELRFSTLWEPGEPISSFTIENVNLEVVSNEAHLTQVKIGVGHMMMMDSIEKSAYPLMSTGSSTPVSNMTSVSRKTFSTSCPNLQKMTFVEKARKSESDKVSHFNKTIGEENDKKEPINGNHHANENSNGPETENREMTVVMTLVEKEHELYEKKYKKKACSVQIDIPVLGIEVNRRTWTAFFEMLGLLGDENDLHRKTSPPPSPPPNIACTISVASWKIGMQYPKNKQQLGAITLNNVDLMVDLANEQTPDAIQIELAVQGLNVEDKTPNYSEFYPDRMVLALPNTEPDRDKKATIKILKYLGDDRTRPCDAKFGLHVPKAMELHYVHTHRFFCGMMDFWMHFNELQDLITKSKKEPMPEGVQSRVLIDVAIECPTLIALPLNQMSEELMVLSSQGLSVSNLFNTMSQVKETVFNEYSIENDYGYDSSIDCMLDIGGVTLLDVEVFEALRVPRLSGKLADVTSWKMKNPDVFRTYAIAISPRPIFSHSFDLAVKMIRNLDNALSHNAPDLSIVMHFKDVEWRMTTAFYILFRGIIEKNFGEPLITVPDTIPIEILHKPIFGCEVGSESKYATLSFRMFFENVQLDCQVPFNPSGIHSAEHTKWRKFGRMSMDKAKISFDAFIDGQSELDLICEKTQLEDTREEMMPADIISKYPIILQQRDPKRQKGLMSEAHLMLRKDEAPVLTLILCNARVILSPDWLQDAMEFVLLFTDFVPKYSDEVKQPAIVGRVGGEQSLALEKTFSVKITLRESDILLIEDPTADNSFALAASTTAVLNMSDSYGQINANLEIQSINFGWCLMQQEKTTKNLCSNDFSVTLALSADRIKEGLNPTKSKHNLEIDIGNMIGRISYKDAGVLKLVLTGFEKYVKAAMGRSMIPRLVAKGPSTQMDLTGIVVRTEHVDMWLLDDHEGNSIPLLRCSASDVHIEKLNDHVRARLSLSADYYNQKIFGWEPVVEVWRIPKFDWKMGRNQDSIELFTEVEDVLNINVTEQLIQQSMAFLTRWSTRNTSFERREFRNQCTKTRSDHLPYMIKNVTGCELHFTTAVDEVLLARQEQRKSANKWTPVANDQQLNFEFPTRLLFYTHLEREPPRQLIIRVNGWDEISPVNVDACGTYFRIIKALKPELKNARLLISVTMEANGKKIVTISSSIEVNNELAHPIAVQTEGTKGIVLTIEPDASMYVPLQFAHHSLSIFPVGQVQVIDHAEVSWNSVKTAGEVMNRTHKLRTRSTTANPFYWLCTAVKREYYPEQEFENLPGHTIRVVAPLNLQNLLPIDVEININKHVFAIPAAKSLLITSVDITQALTFSVATERLNSVAPITTCKANIGDGVQMDMRVRDCKNRFLEMYCKAELETAQSVRLSFWVPFWIVNKSGLPLVIQQDATKIDSAGQLDEHERAKDRSPLMFSYADVNCPKACRIRLGNAFVTEPGYKALLSNKFTLTPGVQALKLKLEHKTLQTLYFNVGVEVRAGTGRYKDTQVVLLTSRFVLQNKSSHSMSVCHHDLIQKQKEHVHLAPQSTVTWNENYAESRMLAVRRADVKHWSCPFLIDRVGSFHVTMRDNDETPRFIRVEIILTSAVFNITFMDADLYPPPIRIENLTDVPVLYQQESKTPASQHLRTICKAKSHVDYAWDDLYGNRRIVLQAFEKKSKPIDVMSPLHSEPLPYENNLFIQLASTFGFYQRNCEESELVLETMEKGKVILNKQNRTDGNSFKQLWKHCKDGCLENIAMNARSRHDTRYVLDVLDKSGMWLTMRERDVSRDKFQQWSFAPDGRIYLRAKPDHWITAKQVDIKLEPYDKTATKGADGVPVSQVWKPHKQRPGSGTLEIDCMYNGPTIVIRITDREERSRVVSEPVLHPAKNIGVFDIRITLEGGIGISVVNGIYEELIYAHFGNIAVAAKRVNQTYQLTGSVQVVQIDNQLLASDKWQVLYCNSEDPEYSDEQQLKLAGVACNRIPALKLEMNFTAMKHYDSFDCFRLNVCDMNAHLDELLLWKFVQMAQTSNAAESFQQRALNLPPNTELEKHDPLRTRRWYFGTLVLQMGAMSLSVSTVSKAGLPPDVRHLKQQFNIKLISFENASVHLPTFCQHHYFETSTFLLESLQKFYFAELQKQTLNIIMTLDAFGNPQGLVTDLKDSFQGLFIEFDVQRFVAGVGYGLSNSVSKVASSVASGVGSLTFDQEHELKRRHNMIRSHSSSSTPLTHLYSGVKGLGVGVFGGATSIFTSIWSESRKSGVVKGMVKGMATGAIDTVTKPVQGVFDFVEGTASAMKELAMPSRNCAFGRVRAPRLCRNLYHLLPPYSVELATAQTELLRINGYSLKEKLLDVETCLEQSDRVNRVKHYVLISTKQCYVCKKENDESSMVIQRIPYKYLKSLEIQPPKENQLSVIELCLEMEESRPRRLHLLCIREVAKRIVEKIQRAKQLYDHEKRTLSDSPHSSIIPLGGKM